MNEAFLDLSKALASFNQDQELEEINITQYDPNSDPVMLVAFRHSETNDLNELRKTAENYVRNELIRLEGIADVEVDGVEKIEVLVQRGGLSLIRILDDGQDWTDVDPVQIVTDLVGSDERAFEHADLGPFDGLRVLDRIVENAGEGEPDLSAVKKSENSVVFRVVVEDLDRAGIGAN